MKKPPLGWQSFQISKNVFRVETELVRNKDWQFYTLLSADRHWDSKYSDHKLQIKHLDQAKERNACIIDGGDLYDAMQGAWDHRKNKADLRPEHQVDNYLDALVKTGANFFEPYAKNFVCIATGNHEQSIEDKHETNLIDRLCGVLNDRVGSHIYNGGYSGYVLFNFKRKPFSNGTKLPSYTVILKYEHGVGGGSSVASNLTRSLNTAKHYPSVDIFFSGHNHNPGEAVISVERVDKHTGSLSYDIQTHIKSGSYKDSHHHGLKGWETAKVGLPPKPKGATWLRFYYEASTNSVQYDVIQAK